MMSLSRMRMLKAHDLNFRLQIPRMVSTMTDGEDADAEDAAGDSFQSFDTSLDADGEKAGRD